jgi:hypothetical protein
MDRRTNQISRITCIVLIFFFSKITAQTDNVIWTSFQLQKDVSKNASISIKPTVRFDNDISSYENTSIEIIAKQKFAKGWSAQFLNRLWFVPDQTNRNFIWFDLAHGFNLNKLKISNRLRLHWALNLNDSNDPDFFRWQTKFSFLNKSKVTPFLAFEPWYRLNKQNQFQRMRYEPGMDWKINSSYTLSILYRREDIFNVPTERFTNFLVLNLKYKI